MNDILEIAAANQQRAREVIRDTDLEAIWRSVGAEANLVGSLRTGLLMKHRDIDFHIYSSPLRVADSFAAMARLAENPRIRRIEYGNLLDAQDQCLTKIQNCTAAEFFKNHLIGHFLSHFI